MHGAGVLHPARLLAALIAAALLFLAGADRIAAQQIGVPKSVILTISSDRLYSDSEFGKRIAREIDEASRNLAAENRRIETELTDEEHQLTEQRPGMEPEEFRKLADAFDAKVQNIRARQDAKARALGQRHDEARGIFDDAARPVLAQVMREAGAGVILERSSVFLSANATDVTDVAIARIDDAIGDGLEKVQDEGVGKETEPAPEPSQD